jgi:hypothetical protein
MATQLPESFTATIDEAARQIARPRRIETASPQDDTCLTKEAVLRELLDDSHARLRELGRSLERLKDYLSDG